MKWRGVLIITFVILLFSNAEAQWLDGYTFRKKITIDNTKVSGSGDHSNFPVLVTFTDVDLKTEANGGNVENASGYDIVFTSSDKTTKLDHYTVSYSATTGAVEIWVKVATLSYNTDTEIYMYYGNCNISSDQSTTNVWSNNFKARYHMNQNPATTNLTDYTGNGYGGASYAGSMDGDDLVSGKVGNALDFDGSDDYVTLNDIYKDNTFTLSAWIKSYQSNNSWHGFIGNSNGDNTRSPGMWIYNNTQIHGGFGDGSQWCNWYVAASSITDGAGASWHYVAYTYDGTDQKIYIDGALVGFSTSPGGGCSGATPYNTTYKYIGRRNNAYKGQIDEVAISSTNRSVDWIATEFNNQNSPGTFYSVAAEEEENQWGGGSTDWNDPNNWSACSVPGACQSVRIKVQANSPTLGADQSVGSLTLESSATLDLNGYNLSICLDFQNNGTLTHNNGTVTLNGSSAQTISGTTSNTFYNLTINNTSGNVTLGQSITVSNTLTFTSGKVILGNNNLTIGSSGSLSGYTSSKYIVTNGTGSLRQQGLGAAGRSGAIDFPVGSSTSSYTPVTITNAGTTDQFNVKVCDGVYNDGNCSGGTQYTEDVINKTWHVEEAVATGSDVTLTFQWNGSDETSGFDRTNCRFGHHDGTHWEFLGSYGSAAGSDPYTFSVSSVNEFSPFGVGGGAGGSPLPIELTRFTAEPVEGEVYLQWQTASETNNDYFTIERSADAIQFEVIETLKGAGNSLEEINYSAVDHHPLSGVSYYRLKQTDYDGSYEYSDIVAVKNDQALKGFTVEMTPNPTEGRIKLDISGVSSSMVNIAIYNTYGEAFYSQDHLINGNTTIIADLEGELPQGTYIVTVENGDKLWSGKLVVL